MLTLFTIVNGVLYSILILCVILEFFKDFCIHTVGKSTFTYISTYYNYTYMCSMYYIVDTM